MSLGRNGLRQLTQKELGVRLGRREYEAAKKQAERKLAGIIERFGDEGGLRREPWYLAKLIAEAVRSNALSRFTLELAELDHYIDRQLGIKKEQPAQNADHSPAITIV